MSKANRALLPPTALLRVSRLEKDFKMIREAIAAGNESVFISQQEDWIDNNQYHENKPAYRKRLAAREQTQEEKEWQAQRSLRGTHFPENPTPADHLRFLFHDLHHDSTHMRFFGLRRFSDKETWRESSLPSYTASKILVSEAIEKINDLAGEEDLYATQADFRWGARGDVDRHRCTATFLKGISTLFVDVDTYNATGEFASKSRDEVLQGIYDVLAQHKIPKPVVISSGRGLYLNWALGHRHSLRYKKTQEKWREVQTKLVFLLAPFGADIKVKDLTRVLRLVGSVNSKNGEAVSVIHDDGKYHSLNSLQTKTRALRVPTEFVNAVRAEEEIAELDTLKNDSLAKNGSSERATAAKRKATHALAKSKKETAVIPFKTPLTQRRHTWRASEDDLASFSRFVSGLMTEFEKKNIQVAQSLTARYFRFFLDLATLAKLRGGVQAGFRNDFVFWSIALLYNARLVTQDTVALVSRELSVICEDKMNAFEAGSLSSLIRRMDLDSDVKARSFTSHSICSGQRGGFSGRVLPSESEFKREGKKGASTYHGAESFKGWGRDVYTPSVKFLINHFAIEPHEQEQMITLIDAVERQRRRSLKNSEHERKARNERIYNARESGSTIEQIIDAFGISQASVYRAISSERKARIEKENAALRGEDVRSEDTAVKMYQFESYYRYSPTRTRTRKSNQKSTVKDGESELFSASSHSLCLSKCRGSEERESNATICAIQSLENISKIQDDHALIKISRKKQLKFDLFSLYSLFERIDSANTTDRHVITPPKLDESVDVILPPKKLRLASAITNVLRESERVKRATAPSEAESVITPPAALLAKHKRLRSSKAIVLPPASLSNRIRDARAKHTQEQAELRKQRESQLDTSAKSRTRSNAIRNPNMAAARILYQFEEQRPDSFSSNVQTDFELLRVTAIANAITELECKIPESLRNDARTQEINARFDALNADFAATSADVTQLRDARLLGFATDEKINEEATAMHNLLKTTRELLDTLICKFTYLTIQHNAHIASENKKMDVIRSNEQIDFYLTERDVHFDELNNDVLAMRSIVKNNDSLLDESSALHDLFFNVADGLKAINQLRSEIAAIYSTYESTRDEATFIEKLKQEHELTKLVRVMQNRFIEHVSRLFIP